MCLCVILTSNLEYLDGHYISQWYIRIFLFLFRKSCTFIFSLGHQCVVLEKNWQHAL